MEPVTVYTPCYNGARYLRRSLPALFAQTLPPAEILVVDDGSTDGSAELARELGRGAPVPVRVLAQPANRGLGAARNRAVREARTPLVAAVDADVVAEPGWLAALVAELDDPSVHGAGGDLRELYQQGLANRWRATHMRQSWGDARLEGVPFLYGANHVYRRETLLEVGLFDERCRTNGEDVDLGRRLLEKGRRLVYTPAAVCHHLRRDTLPSLLDTYWRWRFYGNRRDLSLAWTLKQNRGNFRWWPEHLRADLSAREFGNLAVDLLVPFYRTWRDWKALLASGTAGRARISASVRPRVE